MLCVVFDLDDTLYLERDYVRSGFAAAGAWAEREWCVQDFAERAWREFQSGRRGDIFNHVLAACGLCTGEAVAELLRVYRSHLPRISLLPDSVTCLAALRPHARLAVISDGPLEAQQKKVLALGLDTAVEMMVLTGLWGQEFWKPHPRAFEYVQQQIGVAPGCCVYIGDNPAKDFVAPRRLGWHTIRVRRLGGLHFEREAPAGCSAEYEVHDLRGAASLVLNHIDKNAASLTI